MAGSVATLTLPHEDDLSRYGCMCLSLRFFCFRGALVPCHGHYIKSRPAGSTTRGGYLVSTTRGGYLVSHTHTLDIKCPLLLAIDKCRFMMSSQICVVLHTHVRICVSVVMVPVFVGLYSSRGPVIHDTGLPWFQYGRLGVVTLGSERGTLLILLHAPRDS